MERGQRWNVAITFRALDRGARNVGNDIDEEEIVVALTARNERRIIGGWTRGMEWQMRQLELDHAGELPVRRKAEGIRARAVVRRRMRFPMLAAVLAGLAAVLAVLVLMSCIELTRLSSETVSLKSELAELKNQNTVLSAQHDKIFDLAKVKTAAEAAGMKKPSGSQVRFVDLSGGDSVVIYQQEESGMVSTLMLSVRRGFQAVKEFFD